MPTKLAKDKRAAMFTAGSEVYSAYLLLDMVSSNYYASKDKDFDINGQKISVQEYVKRMIASGTMEADFQLGTRSCHLKLTALPDKEWDVTITTTTPIEPITLKPIHLHQSNDLIHLAQKYPLRLSQDKTGAYKFSAAQVGAKKLTLGGRGKIDLYQLHLSNLYTILTRLQDDTANLDMLVAMATGSGKSFTQALWYLVQQLADNPCFFTVPDDSLVRQLKRDFERLLPVEVTQHIPTITNQDPLAGRESSKWAIMSHKKLLQEHWDFLQDPDTKASGLLLCFDEEHLPAEEELLSKRIKMLAETYPTMFLSATPSEEAYVISGDQPVASLSRKEKEELGIAKAAISQQARARGAIAKSREKKPLSFLENLKMRFVNSIEDERLSTAHEYADQSETAVAYRQSTDPFYVKPETSTPEQLRHFMRWNVLTPIGKKALVLVARHDPVINLSLLRDGQYQNPYKNGNRVLRNGVYNFFQLGRNLDEDCVNNHRDAKEAWRRELFIKHVQEHFSTAAGLERTVDEQVDFADTSKYMEHRVLHGLIENTLTYLLGYDSNELDHRRFHHFDGLRAEVLAKLLGLPKRPKGKLDRVVIIKSIQQKFQEDKFPEQVASEIAAAMFEVLEKLVYENDENQSYIIDNWELDKKLHDLFNSGRSESPLTLSQNNLIAKFIEKHKTIFMVNGLEKTATPIQANRPFFRLEENSYKMDDSVVKQNDALRHKLSPLEALDDVNTKQAIYRPEYCPQEYSPEVVDKLFQRGFVGAYITSEKTTGFNDPHLHHVSMIVDDPEDPMNAPDKIIQGSGRNRGLNPAQQPFFFLTSEGKTQMGFSPQTLDKKNYYPDFFAAKKAHHQRLTQRLGVKIATQMKDFIETNLQPDGSLQTAVFEKRLHDIVMTEFERVYKDNRFDFKKTRKIYTAVLADVYQALYVQAAQIKNAYSMPFVAKVIAGILNFLASIYYNLAIAWSYFKFFLASRKLVKQVRAGEASLLPEATYTHIVRNFSYKNLVATGIPAKRFRDVLKEDAAKTIQFALEQQPAKYLKACLAQELGELFEEVSSYFIRFVGTALQQQQLLQKIVAKKEGLLSKVFPHAEKLGALDEQAVAQYFSIIKTDPEIAAYLAENNLKIELDRPQKVMPIILEMLQKLNGTPDQKKATIKNFWMQNMDSLQFLFLPKDAVFLSQHKAEITVNLLDWGRFCFKARFAAQENPKNLPAVILEFLKKSLPPEVKAAAQQAGCLCPEAYNVAKKEQKLASLKKKMQGPLKDFFDFDAVRDLLAQNLERYLKSPMMKKIIDKLLNPFTEKQLLTLFNTIYPNESNLQLNNDPKESKSYSNAEKVNKLLQFKKDLNRLSITEIFKNYASFEDPRDLEETDMGKIFSWLYELYEEILACECYWHDMDGKGEPYNREKPKLLNISGGSHEIWQKHGTHSHSILTGIAKKTQFLRATQNSFSGLNEVESLRSAHTINTLQETARFFVQPLKKALGDSHPTAGKKASLHQQSLFEAAQRLGDKMRTAKSLSEEEVASSKTSHLNAVQKLR